MYSAKAVTLIKQEKKDCVHNFNRINIQDKIRILNARIFRGRNVP